jgi:hypothetical protein
MNVDTMRYCLKEGLALCLKHLDLHDDGSELPVSLLEQQWLLLCKGLQITQ